MEQQRKARKIHECYCCGKDINPGELYLYGETRTPKYEDNDIFCNNKQIGVNYIKFHLCDMCQ